MQLFGIDAYNGSVFLMHSLDLKCHLATVSVNEIVVHFVPMHQCSKFGTGEFCQWAQIQPIKRQKKTVKR